jgi:2-iminobutanoate/2-iminopropanoate deaminase
MAKQIINTEKAPAAIGPYSQAVSANGFVFTSGQLPIDTATGVLADGITAQTKQSLENVKSVLEKAGATLGNVVKTTVFLSDMENFSAMNEVYKTYFTENFPARSAVQVARLPKDALVEIEATAIIGD